MNRVPPNPVANPFTPEEAVLNGVAHPVSADSNSELLRQIGGYRLLLRLGEGGMSTVYLAYDSEQRRSIAIKILADHLAHERTFVQRFYREANMSRLLDHPHIVKGFTVGQDAESKRHFLIMEYVEGSSLQRMLDERGRLSVSFAVRAVLDVAQALEYLHDNNYVHRDIKPGNILIDPNGHAKLIDLGLAKHLEATGQLTLAEQGLGTSYYMPFEQARNPCLVDGRSDIFALGATLYHLVTGEVPFAGYDHVEIARAKERGEYIPAGARNPDVPVILDDILTNMLALDPRKRYASASALIAELQASGLEVDSSENPAVAVFEEPTTDNIQLAKTRVDLPLVCALLIGDESGESPANSVWSLRYRRDNGVWLAHQATTQQILDWSEMGLLPAEVFVARSGQNQFRDLRAYPEFCNLPEVTSPKASASKVPNPLKVILHIRRTQLVVALGIVLVVGAFAYWLVPTSSKSESAMQESESPRSPSSFPEKRIPRPMVQQPEPPPPPPLTVPGVVICPAQNAVCCCDEPVEKPIQ